MLKNRYTIKSGPLAYQAATPQDALALAEQMASEGMEDVWIIDETPGAAIMSLETLRSALKGVSQPSEPQRGDGKSSSKHA